MPRTRVLVVEDNPELRALYSLALQGAELDVITAADGEEALTIAAVTPPSIVVSDLDMPRRDGLGLVRSLRQRGGSMPVLVITGADARDRRADELVALGAEVRPKPVTMVWLRQRVQALALEAEKMPAPAQLVDVERQRRRERMPLHLRAEMGLAILASVAGCAALIAMAIGGQIGGLEPFAAQIVNRCLGVVSAALLGGAYLHVRRSSRAGSTVLWASAIVWWVLMLALPATEALLLPVGLLAALAATAALAPRRPARRAAATA